MVNIVNKILGRQSDPGNPDSYKRRGRSSLPDTLSKVILDKKSSIVEACNGWISDTIALSPYEISNGSGPIASGRLVELLENPSDGITKMTFLNQTIDGMTGDGAAIYVYYEDQLYVASGINTGGSYGDKVSVYLNTKPGSANWRKTITVPREDVIIVPFRVDKRGKYYTPLESVEIEIATDYIRAWRTGSLLHNEAAPNAIISPKEGVVTIEAISRIVKKYQKGATTERGRAQGFTEALDIIFPPGTNLKSLDMSAVSDIAESRVCSVLRTDPQIVKLGVGLKTTKVGAALHEAELAAWRGSVEPMQKRIETALSSWLPERLGISKSTIIKFNNDDLPVLEAEREVVRQRKSERLLNELDRGIIDEAFYREQMGYEQ